MAERLDALTVRESNGKSYFTKIGAAFQNKDGKGWSILLDAMPASNEGQFKIMLREPLPPREGGEYGRQHSDGSRSGGQSPSGGNNSFPTDDLDDEIPGWN